MRFERDRRRFVAARARLREALARRLGVPPADVRFAAGPAGKPCLAPPFRRSGWRFNLAGYAVGRPLEKLGRHAQDTCEIYFDGARVPAANLLGASEGRGFSQMTEQLPYERLAIAVNAVASAELGNKIMKELVAWSL